MALVKEADVFESWEDMDEAQLERQAAEYLASRAPMTSHAPPPVLAPPAPASAPALGPGVRILKRPTGASGAGAMGDNRQRPMRTLLQRQQDYEAARLRIMGEAKCPDDAQQIIPNLQIKSDTTRLQNIKSREKTLADFNPSLPPPASTPIGFVTMQPRVLNQPQPSNGISLLRTPKGPDNTKGFHLKR